MVSTRGHPGGLPETPASTRKTASPTNPSTPSTALTTTKQTSTASAKLWSHTPSNITLLWLAVSLPLVVWDTGFVLLRPHTMPGGSLHWPIWQPYKLYGEVDHTYGFKAWNSNEGFTGAQGSMNVIETLGAFLYLWLVYSYGEEVRIKGRGAPKSNTLGRLARAREVKGRAGAWAVIIGLVVATMTQSKTVLYWLREVFSGYEGVRHNDVLSLIFLFIIPNGLWLIFPAYMMYVFGSEILEGLTASSGVSKKVS